MLHVSFTYEIPAYRTGWIGVWDSIRSAVRGDTRPLAPHPYTLEFWIKHNDAGIDSDNPDVREKAVYVSNVLHKENL